MNLTNKVGDIYCFATTEPLPTLLILGKIRNRSGEGVKWSPNKRKSTKELPQPKLWTPDLLKLHLYSCSAQIQPKNKDNYMMHDC